MLGLPARGPLNLFKFLPRSNTEYILKAAKQLPPLSLTDGRAGHERVP